MLVANSFSLNMLTGNEANVVIKKTNPQYASYLLKNYGYTSYVGHADIAAIASKELEVKIEVNREALELPNNFELLVIQYRGPRLPEGTKELPKGAKIEYFIVSGIVDDYSAWEENEQWR